MAQILNNGYPKTSKARSKLDFQTLKKKLILIKNVKILGVLVYKDDIMP